MSTKTHDAYLSILGGEGGPQGRDMDIEIGGWESYLFGSDNPVPG
jgi:hypothetical protein